MLKPRSYLLASLGAVTLASSVFVASGCKPKPSTSSGASSPATASATAPQAFTAKLTEIKGVQAIYTLRHPKLILAELETLMTAVPEASMARLFLGGLAPYGYPEFSEIAAGSNVGIALLEITAEELAAEKPTMVAFAKLKEGGKIWTALAEAGVALKKDGEWTWIAQDAAAFDRVVSAAAVYEHISQPQTEELRAWGRLSPALLATAKEAVFEKLKTSLESFPADEQTAYVAYADVAWSHLAQLHSGGGSLDLNEHGVTLFYYGQFTPDSPLGRYLRYTPGQAPAIAASVPADGLFSAVIRQNMTAQSELVDGIFDALLAVDYPAGVEVLKAAKTGFRSFSKGSDGSSVVTINMTMPKGDRTPEVSMLGVSPGNYTQADVLTGYKATMDLSKRFTNAIVAGASAFAPGVPAPVVTMELTENAFEIEGTRFGSVLTTTTAKGADDGEDRVEKTTQFFGVVGGTLVSGSDEAMLRAKLPDIVAKRVVARPVNLPFAEGEILVGAVHGERIVDMVIEGAEIDTTDEDMRALVDSFKQGFAAAGPVKMAFAGQQAKASIAISIPYKFVSQSVRLGQFAVARAVQESKATRAGAAAGSGAAADVPEESMVGEE